MTGPILEKRGKKRPRDVLNPTELQQQGNAMSMAEDETTAEKTASSPTLRLRAYQQEMVTESLHQNIIVAVSLWHLSTLSKHTTK